jgi:putative redox protein
MTDEFRDSGEVTFEKAKFTLQKVRERLQNAGPGGTTPAPPSRVQVRWAGEHRFDTGRPGGPVARLDGSANSGQSPVDAILSALASCIAVDVVDILQKRKTPITSLTSDVTARRATTVPRRITSIRLDWIMEGPTIDRENAERAIELSMTKYCSVHDSLAHDIAIEWSLSLNGEAGQVKTDPTRV